MQFPPLPQPRGASAEVRQLLCFRLGGIDFAVDILRCQEILRLEPIAPVPAAPSFVQGMLNLRGGVAVVVDLIERFRLDGVEPITQATGAPERILVLRLGDERVQRIALRVRDVRLQQRVTPEDLQEPPPFVAGLPRRFLEGIYPQGQRLFLLLDVDEVLSPQQLEQLARLDAEAGDAGDGA